MPNYLRILHKSCTLKEINYYYDAQVRKDKMGGMYNTHGRQDNYT